MTYAVGHVKRDPVTQSTATKTIFPAGLAWSVSTINKGGQNARTEDVELWDDIYIPGSD